MSFIKKTEDFTCEKCGTAVIGNGFTNHCPKCLWSKHVDVSPGDRAAQCGGLMEPVDFFKERNEFVFLHKCTACGHEKKNKMSPDDDFDQALEIINKKVRDSA